MTRRIAATDRLIAALGLLVLMLGAVVLWVATHGGGLGRDEAPGDRVRRQVRERDRGMQVVYTEAGRTPGVICGYAGPTRKARARGYRPDGWKFVSRRNRILFDTDPLTQEFADQFARECPGFLEDPRKAS